MSKVMSLILCMMMICAPCFGQSKYNNELQPGLSTRNDATRALGHPIRTLSATQFEYRPGEGFERLVVEYRGGSAVIERIEAQFIKPVSRSAMIAALKLPEQSDAKKTNAQGKLVEYFREDALVLTYASAEASSGVKSLGYYSRELFSAVAEGGTDTRAEARPAATTSAANTSASPAANTSPALSAAEVTREVNVPDGTEIEIQLTNTISGQEMKLGNLVDFTVVRPVQTGGVTIFEKDAPARARITMAKKAGRWGKAGKLEWAMQDVLAVDGNRVSARFTKREIGDSKGGTVAVAAVATTVMLGPAGLLWGLKKGKPAVIPAGNRYTVFVHGDTMVKVHTRPPRTP